VDNPEKLATLMHTRKRNQMEIPSYSNCDTNSLVSIGKMLQYYFLRTSFGNAIVMS
jgi:hypothetical protein